MPAGLWASGASLRRARFLPGSPRAAGPTPAAPSATATPHRGPRASLPDDRALSPGSVSPEEESGSVENVLPDNQRRGRMVKMLASTQPPGPSPSGG